jgi:diadenylate cyclase
MMPLIRETFFSLRLLDIADMVMVAALLWSAMVLLRRTRARVALTGLAILGVVYLFARQLGLRVTAGILQGFFAVLVIVVVVVFQEDLRRFFEQIGSWGLRRRPQTLRTGMTDLIVRAVVQLAATRTGALLVIPGAEDLDRHLDGGISLNGHLSEPILLSLFDASSPGHDGAAILRGSEVERFAVHLPLSSDHAQLGVGGTRHAAALGLAERTDALCVVVSEERGKVSVASHGVLRTLKRPEELADELGRFLQETSPEKQSEPLWRRLRGVWKEASISILLAALLWVMFVPGSSVTAVTHRVPVLVDNLPRGYVLEEIDPPEVEVTLEGRRRDAYLVNRASLGVRLDALLVKLGRRTFEITPANLEHPPNLTVVQVTPDRVRLSVRPEEEKAARPSTPPMQQPSGP